MIEALFVVLFLGFLIASVTSIIGVVIGLRQKRWKFAIISGSATGVLFVLALIAAGFSNFEETDSEPTIAKSVSEPTPIPTATPTPIPEPTPIPVVGLGISRDEVQKRFERDFREISFEASESTEGVPNVIGFFSNKRLMLVLEGEGGELREASILFTIAGGTHEEFEKQMDAVYLLGDLVVPEWEGFRDWMQEVLTFLAEHDVADFETTQDDKRIAFSYAPSTAQALFTIGLQGSDTVITVPEPKPTPISVGRLGISRAEAQQSFGNVGYRFEPSIPRNDGQPQSVAFGYNDKVMIVLTGSDDTLVTGIVSGDIVDTPSETAIAMALLAQTLMPSDFQSVVDWLTSTMTMVTDDPARYMEREFTQTYGDKQVTFSTLSTELTGQVMFKIDSLVDTASTAETQTITEPEFDCSMVRRVYWLVRNVGDHQAAMLSVYDEMVLTNPNADFGVETAARALDECGIEE